MIERLEFNGIDVGSLGTQIIGTLTNANPALKFIVQETGIIKGIGDWLIAPIVSIGTNGPKNNLLPNNNLTNVSLRGKNRSMPNVWAYDSGTDISLKVITAGTVDVGTPLVDVYLIGIWQDITSA